MLRSPALPGLLRQVATDGIKNALIMNDQGSLIGSLNDKECDESIVAAIVSNVWSEFEASQADMDAGKLLSQTFVFETRVVMVGKILDRFLVCVYGDPDVSLGLLRRKHEVLCKHLAEQFSKLDIGASAES